MSSVNPGDVTINSLQLTSQSTGKSVNILNQVVAINFYESIMAPTLYCELLIYDAVDLFNYIPIRGEEQVEVSFATPGDDQGRDVTFNVIKPTDMKSGKIDKEKQYTLRCITNDHLFNAKQKFSKKYNDSSTNIIKSILNTQLNSNNQFYNEETKGQQDILISKMYPFEAIDLIRRRSVSKQYNSHSFCFFENKNGYNFFTLEYLMANNRGNIGNKVFFYDSSVQEDFLNITMRNIIGLRFVNQGDTIKSIGHGGFNNSTRKYDFYTKTMTPVNFNNLQQGKFQYPDPNGQSFNTQQFESQYNDKTPQFFMIPGDTSRPENYIHDMIGPQTSFVQKLAQNIVHIKIFGDSTLGVGDVITCTLPTMAGFSGAPQEAKLTTANFIVSKLRHMISLAGRWYYHQSLELYKASVYQE